MNSIHVEKRSFSFLLRSSFEIKWTPGKSVLMLNADKGGKPRLLKKWQIKHLTTWCSNGPLYHLNFIPMFTKYLFQRATRKLWVEAYNHFLWSSFYRFEWYHSKETYLECLLIPNYQPYVVCTCVEWIILAMLLKCKLAIPAK